MFSPSLLSLRQQHIGESSLTVFEQSLVALAPDITLCSASNEKSWGLSQSEIPPKQLLRPHSLQVLVCELRSGSTGKGQATWEGKKDYYTLRKGNNEWITAVANWTLTPLGTLWIVPGGAFYLIAPNPLGLRVTPGVLTLPHPPQELQQALWAPHAPESGAPLNREIQADKVQECAGDLWVAIGIYVVSYGTHSQNSTSGKPSTSQKPVFTFRE